jgi:hypothetical protein
MTLASLGLESLGRKAPSRSRRDRSLGAIEFRLCALAANLGLWVAIVCGVRRLFA